MIAQTPPRQIYRSGGPW